MFLFEGGKVNLQAAANHFGVPTSVALQAQTKHGPRELYSEADGMSCLDTRRDGTTVNLVMG